MSSAGDFRLGRLITEKSNKRVRLAQVARASARSLRSAQVALRKVAASPLRKYAAHVALRKVLQALHASRSVEVALRKCPVPAQGQSQNNKTSTW